MRLSGKRAVVTGGGSGIGAATARLFAAEGARVAILDYQLPSAEQMAAQIRRDGGDAVAFACDVSDESQVADSVGRAAQYLGAIDTVFNSAGIAIRRAVPDTETIDWDRVIDTNLRGSFLSSKYCLQHFSTEGGSIIHVSSVTGLTGVRGRAAYSATKGALIALTRNMAIDLAARNIRVNCVCPGFVRTPPDQGSCRGYGPACPPAEPASAGQAGRTGRCGHRCSISRLGRSSLDHWHKPAHRWRFFLRPV